MFARYGVWAVAMGFAVEGMGGPVPMELLYGLTGSLMRRRKTGYAGGVLVAALGSFTGNMAGYALGYYGGRKLVHYACRKLKISSNKLDALEERFKENALRTVFVMRWVGWGFAQVVWISGITRVNVWKFAAVVLVLVLMWATVWTFAGYRVIAYLADVLTPGAIALIALTVLALVAVTLQKRFRSKPQAVSDPDPDDADE